MALIMENVTKQYGALKALDKVNIRFEENSVVGLIGFNGSGKTTSFNIITNLIEKFEGKIFIEETLKKTKKNENGETVLDKNGKPVLEDKLNRRPLNQIDRTTISYLSAGAEPQNTEKVIEQLNYVGFLHGLSKKKTKEQILEAAKILEFEDKLNKQIKSLSKGNQQKVKLVAMFINPNIKYLLLDEPFDGLDPIMVEKIKNYILDRKKDKTIIITSHRMDVVDQMCDSFYILKDGILVDSKTNKDEDSTVIVAVNKEIPVTKLKAIKGVISVSKKPNETILIIEDINSFKAINKKLIAEPKYIWSSYREKKLTESVFERYA